MTQLLRKKGEVFERKKLLPFFFFLFVAMEEEEDRFLYFKKRKANNFSSSKEKLGRNMRLIAAVVHVAGKFRPLSPATGRTRSMFFCRLNPFIMCRES